MKNVLYLLLCAHLSFGAALCAKRLIDLVKENNIGAIRMMADEQPDLFRSLITTRAPGDTMSPLRQAIQDNREQIIRLFLKKLVLSDKSERFAQFFRDMDKPVKWGDIQLSVSQKASPSLTNLLVENSTHPTQSKLLPNPMSYELMRNILQHHSQLIFDKKFDRFPILDMAIRQKKNRPN